MTLFWNTLKVERLKSLIIYKIIKSQKSTIYVILKIDITENCSCVVKENQSLRNF